MFGTVKKGPSHTRFRLEIALGNGCIIYEVFLLPNVEIEKRPAMYGAALDHLTSRLDARVKARV